MPEFDFITFSTSYENVILKTNDNKSINAYFLKQRGNLVNTSPTIVCFLGNTGTFSQRFELVKNLFTYCISNVLFIEYRIEKPSEKGYYSDAKVALDYIFSRRDVDKSKVVLFGQSIGGAVAINAGMKQINRMNQIYSIFCYF